MYNNSGITMQRNESIKEKVSAIKNFFFPLTEQEKLIRNEHLRTFGFFGVTTLGILLFDKKINSFIQLFNQ